jgi:DNA replication protein
MIEFKGFPSRMRFTPIPNIVFSSLMPQISDVTELKVLLYILAIIYPKKGKLRFANEKELIDQSGIKSDKLQNSLTALIQKGALLRLEMGQVNPSEYAYCLNTDYNREILNNMVSGELVTPGFQLAKPISTSLNTERPADIFSIYEENIGMLTPLIADELKEAGKHYPEVWIRDAIKEAAALNKRSWRYISRILEHWSTEGKDDGAHRGYPKTNADPDKYIRGKYGHMVQR